MKHVTTTPGATGRPNAAKYTVNIHVANIGSTILNGIRKITVDKSPV